MNVWKQILTVPLTINNNIIESWISQMKPFPRVIQYGEFDWDKKVVLQENANSTVPVIIGMLGSILLYV